MLDWNDARKFIVEQTENGALCAKADPQINPCRGNTIAPVDPEKSTVATSDLLAWLDTLVQPGPVATDIQRWPWGEYETELLKKLAASADRFWKNYDPEQQDTAPTNDEVIAWLVAQNVSGRIASAMATILRADGLPTGPRK